MKIQYGEKTQSTTNARTKKPFRNKGSSGPFRYLDPDVKDKATDGGVIITLYYFIGLFRHRLRSCCCALQSRNVSLRCTSGWADVVAKVIEFYVSRSLSEKSEVVATSAGR